MKIRILAALLVAAATLTAQVPEPEFANVFVAVDGSKLVQLERETATIKAGGGGFIVAGAKAAYEVPGSKSPVRFHSGQPLDFAVRTPLAGGAVDPGGMFILRHLESKKRGREAVFMNGHFSPIGGSTTTDLSRGSVPVTFSKYGEQSIKISAGPLPPGEYALSVSYGQSLFCFGVD